MSPVQPPTFTILSGPNGSGKSTFYTNLKLGGKFINADNVARKMSGGRAETAALAAGRKVLAQLSKTIALGETFTYETTLSSHQSLSLMARCKAAGYTVELVFVTLRNVELNIRRIAERVARGGHNIPEPVVRRRHESAFRQLPKATALADKVLIFDNSEISYELLLELDGNSVRETHLQLTVPHHVRLAQAIAEGRKQHITSLLAPLR